MGRQPTTRLQLSGYRFLVRRMEHALVRGDVRMLDDPLRGQTLALVAGAAVAVIIVVASVVLAFLRPGGALDAAPIVMDRSSGALYVRVGDAWHPVPNLASARLIVGSPATPRAVAAGAISAAKRGPSVGIAGAPAIIGESLSDDEIGWTICDSASTTTLIVGRPGSDGRPEPPAADGNVLVTDGAAATYLIYDGWRARIDLRDATVVRVLGLDGVVPRPVSPAVLQTVPEAPPIAAPRIPQAGAPGFGGFAVGTVVRMVRAQTTEHYVVLAGAVQRIGAVAADLIRFTVAQPAGDIRTVAADTIAAARSVDLLPVGMFPRQAGVVERPVLCAGWTPHGAGRTNTSVTVGDSLPAGELAAVVGLAQADGGGPAIDAVAMPAGRSAYLRSTGVTGDGALGGSLFMLNDLGVLFGVRDAATAAHLGLAEHSAPAPWSILARLPRGPELSKEAASVLRDGTPA